MKNLINRMKVLTTNIGLSKVVILLMIPVVTVINYDKHKWVNPEDVIEWDVKSYYAYLPALFVHGDLELKFIDENYKEHIKWIWPVDLESGDRLIVTSMGMSLMYLPFFLIGHGVAHITPYDATGYTVPYAFTLVFSSLFYVIVGMFYLRKILLKFTNEFITTITILLIFFGTNLLYYTTYNAAMSHSYNFALITIFIFHTMKWHKMPSLRNTIIIGLLFGLIVLIRPTNIVIILFFILYDVKSLKELKDRLLLFIFKWKKVLFMVLSFFIVWIPQFIYWKFITGQFLFYSYGEKNASFFWDNPQIYDILFSFRKGWFLYTPLMVFTIFGFITIYRKHRKFFWPILVTLLVFIYVNASWWCWWFGGSYGNRAFVDIYGAMGVLLATFLTGFSKRKVLLGSVLTLLLVLCLHNFFMIKKFNHYSIHYWWNSRESYFENFFRVNPKGRFWKTVPVPDYDKARKGVYVAKKPFWRYSGKYDITPEMIVEEIKNDIYENQSVLKFEKFAKKHSISVDSAVSIKAWNIYEKKWSLDTYTRPIEKRLEKNVKE